MPITAQISEKEATATPAKQPRRSGNQSGALRVALIGASGYAKAHLRLITMASNKGLYRLVGAAVINQAEEQKRCEVIKDLGGILYSDFDSMITQLAGQLDICFIPTGIHHHAPMTISALKSGANVLVEKPVAATIQDVAAIRKCAEKTGRFVAVGFQSIYDPATRWLKNALTQGAIGKIRSIRSRAMWPRPLSYYARNNWAGHLKADNEWVLDSPFNNALAHQLNLMCFLASNAPNSTARPATVQAELYRTLDIESTDTACIRIVTENQIPLHYYASHSCLEVQNPLVEVIGESGVASWSLTQAKLHPDGEQPQFVQCGNFNFLLGCVGTALHKHYTDEKAPICSLDIAEAHTLCVNGAHESSAIYTIPTNFISEIKLPNGDSQFVINGLSTHMAQAYKKEKLFSELAIPWAQSGDKIDLQGYKHFPTYRNS